MKIKTYVARLKKGQFIDKRLGLEEIKDLLEIKAFEKEYEKYMRQDCYISQRTLIDSPTSLMSIRYIRREHI